MKAQARASRRFRTGEGAVFGCARTASSPLPKKKFNQKGREPNQLTLLIGHEIQSRADEAELIVIVDVQDFGNARLDRDLDCLYALLASDVPDLDVALIVRADKHGCLFDDLDCGHHRCVPDKLP